MLEELPRITMRFLPPNCTDVLQVMDLVVNGPLKAHARAMRAQAEVDHLIVYKQQLQEFQAASNLVSHAVSHDTSEVIVQKLRNAAKAKDPGQFSPKKVDLQQFVRNIQTIVSSKFTTDDFQQSLRACFVAVGLAPQDAETRVYRTYKGHSNTKAQLPPAFYKAIDMGEPLKVHGLVNAVANFDMDVRAENDAVEEGGLPELLLPEATVNHQVLPAGEDQVLPAGEDQVLQLFPEDLERVHNADFLLPLEQLGPTVMLPSFEE